MYKAECGKITLIGKIISNDNRLLMAMAAVVNKSVEGII